MKAGLKNLIFASMVLLYALPSLSAKKVTFFSSSSNEQSCAVFQCVEGAEHCAESIVSGDSISVTLSPICGDKEYCDIGGIPYEEIYKGQNLTGTCQPVQLGDATRYPGEDCNANEDCKVIEGIERICQDGKCAGRAKDKKCSSSDQCLLGLYCDQKTGRCEKQKAEFETCNSSFDCENKYLCFQGVCTDTLFKRPIGETITDAEEGVDAKYYCEYSMAKDNVCVATGFDTVEYNKEPIIECNRGESCFYNYYPLNMGSFFEECQCGYNADGKGDCPIPTSVNNEAWQKMMIMKRYQIDNQCHTKSRFNCYLHNYDIYKLFTFAKDELDEGNVYYGSVDCAKKVWQGYDDLFDYTQ